jgi:hypothetical protein
MKKGFFLLAAVVLSFSFTAMLANAQDLGGLARESRARKMKVMQERSVRIWSNENMPRRPAGEGPTAAAGISAAPLPPPDAGVAPAPPDEASAPAPSAAAGDDKKRTKEYWQGRFKPIRQHLADMEEQQRLVEDELSLLQIQRARELSFDVQGQLEAQIKAATANVEARRAETAKVRKELEETEKEFKDSGAPADWAKTD